MRARSARQELVSKYARTVKYIQQLMRALPTTVSVRYILTPPTAILYRKSCFSDVTKIKKFRVVGMRERNSNYWCSVRTYKKIT